MSEKKKAKPPVDPKPAGPTALEKELAAADAAKTPTQKQAEKVEMTVDDLKRSMARIHEHRKKIATLEMRVQKKNEEYKTAKGELEAAEVELRTIIDEENTPNLFNQAHAKPAAPAAVLTPEQKKAEADKKAADEAWRDDRVTVLDLPAAVNGKLFQADIRTMGNLHDYLAKNGGTLKGLTGVGEKSISDVMDAYKKYDDKRTAEAKKKAAGK